MQPDHKIDAQKTLHVARHIWKRMTGGSGSLLISDSQSQLWVVKFTQNPQHHRLQLNEFLATRIAQRIGLTVPQPGIIQVPEEVIGRWIPKDLSPELKRIYTPGFHYGSRFAGDGLMPGRVAQALFPDQLRLVDNLEEVVGALAFDTWLNQRDLRQAVFARKKRSSRFTAFWIDHGACFGAGSWNLDSPCGPVYRQNSVYDNLSGWSGFEPWLYRIEKFPVEQLWAAFYETPGSWRCGEEAAFEDLLEQLKSRQRRAKSLLLDVIYRRRRYFSKWPDHLRSTDPVQLARAMACDTQEIQPAQVA